MNRNHQGRSCAVIQGTSFPLLGPQFPIYETTGPIVLNCLPSNLRNNYIIGKNTKLGFSKSQLWSELCHQLRKVLSPFHCVCLILSSYKCVYVMGQGEITPKPLEALQTFTSRDHSAPCLEASDTATAAKQRFRGRHQRGGTGTGLLSLSQSSVGIFLGCSASC